MSAYSINGVTTEFIELTNKVDSLLQHDTLFSTYIDTNPHWKTPISAFLVHTKPMDKLLSAANIVKNC